MSLVYCRRCGAPNLAGKPTCRSCGTWDPDGRRSTVVGAFLLATVAAAAITGGYAFAVSREWFWERWERRFDLLPDDHALRGHAWDVAFVLGVGVFVLSWLLAAVGLSPRARGRRRSLPPGRSP